MLANIEDYLSKEKYDPGFIYVDKKGEVKIMNATKADLVLLEKNLDKKIDKVESSLNERITEVETNLDKKIDKVESSLNERITEVETNLSGRITEVETKIDTVDNDLKNLEKEHKDFRQEVKEKFDKIDAKFDLLETRLTRGMFILLAAIFLGVVLNNWKSCIDWLLRFF